MKKSFRIVVGSLINQFTTCSLCKSKLVVVYGFIGANLIQSGFTKWCLLETILAKLGVKD
jgi:hypothetical protein